MYKNDKSTDEQNFWISYADLMAGLLFVFILLVGAIVVRYVFVQQDLEAKRAALGESESLRSSQNEKIKLFKERLAIATQNLQKQKEEDRRLQEQLSLKHKDVVKLKELLMGYELENASIEENLTALQDEVADIKQQLSEKENILILKDEELAVLGEKLLEESKAHQMVVDELNITKVKIKNLTGIRIKVVEKLRETLGSSIMIDPKSGAMTFSSNILFNAGEYRLKPEAKKELSAIIKRYIHTLLFDEALRGYIDQITIEGHTDTDGSYLYNLALSQKRALEVMKFLYEDDPDNRALYRAYLSASGRSFSDLIVDANGDEDKEASRRIEIKFRIKNEEAVKELENFLNRGK
jgi:chemotaxis protein MotB